jgi:hypothetical protein
VGVAAADLPASVIPVAINPITRTATPSIIHVRRGLAFLCVVF